MNVRVKIFCRRTKSYEIKKIIRNQFLRQGIDEIFPRFLLQYAEMGDSKIK